MLLVVIEAAARRVREELQVALSLPLTENRQLAAAAKALQAEYVTDKELT